MPQIPLPRGGGGIEEMIMQLMEGGAPGGPPGVGGGMPPVPPGVGAPGGAPAGPPAPPPMPDEPDVSEPTLESPDGSEWRIIVDDEGNLDTEKVFDPEDEEAVEELEV